MKEEGLGVHLARTMAAGALDLDVHGTERREVPHAKRRTKCNARSHVLLGTRLGPPTASVAVRTGSLLLVLGHYISLKGRAY